jgi:hypothetical protein
MDHLSFEYDFSYSSIPGVSRFKVIQDILHSAGDRAVIVLRNTAPHDTGKLAASHVAIREMQAVTIESNIPGSRKYTPFVKPKGKPARWPYYMRRELRNAVEDVSLEKFGDVEEAFLLAIGPKPRTGERAEMLEYRAASRLAGVERSSGTSRYGGY